MKLAVVYQLQGRLKEGEILLVKLIEIRKECFGEDDPKSLELTAHLACNYFDQSRVGEAEQLYLRNISLGRKVLGEKHPAHLRSGWRLAEVFLQQH